MTAVQEQAFQRLHKKGFSSNQDLLDLLETVEADQNHTVTICAEFWKILKAYDPIAPGSFIVRLYPLEQDCIPIYLIQSGNSVYSSKGLMFSGLYNIKQPGDINKTIYLYLVGEHYAEAGMRAALEQQPDAQVVKIETQMV